LYNASSFTEGSIMDNAKKVLVICRGCSGSGKSFRAKQLLEEYAADGQNGVIYSTDEYWYKILKPEQPEVYNFNPRFLSDAHRWNRVRAQKAIEEGVTPIIIDNTNVTASEPKPYVSYAEPQGYEIRIEEPTSEWWLEIRELLRNKRSNKKALKDWAKKLEEKNTHSVPAFAIERMMWKWECDITVEKILNAPDIKG
jgi:AAA domain